MNILIIDEDAAAADSLAAALHRLGGHRVNVAPSGADGLKLATTCALEVLAIDENLSDVSSLDVLRTVRSLKTVSVSCFVLTAHGSITHAIAAIRAGAVDYLQKTSLDVVELARRIGGTPVARVPQDARIATVLASIASNPTTSVVDLASNVCLSESRLHHLFLDETGTSLGAHLREARLTRAALHLADSFRTIQDIAFDSGWLDPSAFSEAFRRRFGCTPRAYRIANKPQR